jgi:hypothetical protein
VRSSPQLQLLHDLLPNKACGFVLHTNGAGVGAFVGAAVGAAVGACVGAGSCAGACACACAGACACACACAGACACIGDCADAEVLGFVVFSFSNVVIEGFLFDDDIKYADEEIQQQQQQIIIIIIITIIVFSIIYLMYKKFNLSKINILIFFFKNILFQNNIILFQIILLT